MATEMWSILSCIYWVVLTLPWYLGSNSDGTKGWTEQPLKVRYEQGLYVMR